MPIIREPGLAKAKKEFPKEQWKRAEQTAKEYQDRLAKKRPRHADLVIRFATKEQALAFATWLCESGEQQYWDWADCQIAHPMRTEDRKNYVAAFDYHRNGKGFCKDLFIHTCGVLVSEDFISGDPLLCTHCHGHGRSQKGLCKSCGGSGIA